MTRSRAYHSPRRKRQAETTRSEILAVARRMFAARGYAATSLSAIAAEAGVSVPTLYTSVGSKAEVARALVAFIDEEAGMVSLAAAQILAATPEALIRANARLARVLNERCGDIMNVLLTAALSDPDVVPAAAEGRRLHRTGCRMVIERLVALGGLTDSLTVDRATAVLASSTSPDAIERLTREHGWSYDEVESWLAHAMTRLLVRPGKEPVQARRR
jgi:TetR/AcrR family transcriptional regulator, regulator of cefoperazone and chloramphenicol sensitivity